MKNLFFSCAVVAMAFVSCDNDDAPVSNPELTLVTSSNTSGKVTYVNLLEPNAMVKSFTISSLDAEGVSYNPKTDTLIVASRTNNRLEAYSGVKAAAASGSVSLSLSLNGSNLDFTNARETAVSGDKIIVAQDESASNGLVNKLLVYKKTATGFMLLNSYTVNFKLWGIHMEGNDLYAVVDLTGDIVQFKNIMSNASGAITATKRVTIEGLVRTHGISYSAKDNVMVLTDVGAAASDSDGGLIFIKNFMSVFASTANMGTISTSNQIRIYGPNSQLGNPVDVAYDYATDIAYVAERLNGGGKVLSFARATISGDATPLTVRTEAGVTSIFVIRK
ncbi:hypothetical protein GCM10008015_12670 [Flavobacterium palustre]|uniref:Uncharacterized protein n=1 Tax=Flavobacterium palustre TaxID=1476463 RepID=A0ABQ1HEG5_9FLAO|nr:hypothetical protein [Flavobacterium palustre]GGA73502.1 hypothetical protein GCM10008015_12670 [Flavobacterium palustre]